MKHLIDKSAIVAEIKKIKSYIGSDRYLSDYEKGCNFGREDVCDSLLNFINTLEVKDANEALRTEYEKGRHDVIEKTLEWVQKCIKFLFVTTIQFSYLKKNLSDIQRC